MRSIPRDRNLRLPATECPHRFWLVVGTAFGNFPGWAQENSRDRFSRAFQNDGPRCFWLVVSAAIGKFYNGACRHARDSGTVCQANGCLRRFSLVVGATVLMLIALAHQSIRRLRASKIAAAADEEIV